MSDPEAPNKHNALLEYMDSSELRDQHLMGGVIIEKNGLWYYSKHPITTTADLTGWDAFFPKDYLDNQ